MIDEDSTTAHRSDAEAELRAALETCALATRTDLMLLLGDGPDLLGLLQRLGTGDVAGLTAGHGTPTVLTSNKGRIVERLFVNHLGDRGVILVGGPGPASRVLEHLKRYTFAEKTGLADVGSSSTLYTLTGPRSADALEAAGLPCPAPHRSVEGTAGGARAHVLGHDGVSAGGRSVLMERNDGPRIREALSRAVEAVGGRRAGLEALEAARILGGLPAGGAELTEAYNPLEAGLWDAVSFAKGCYVGQEVVARLRTYDKVSRALWVLRLSPGSAAPEPGAAVFADGREVGRITSSVIPPGRADPIALAYVKHKQVTAGATLAVGSADSGLTAIAVPPPPKETP